MNRIIRRALLPAAAVVAIVGATVAFAQTGPTYSGTAIKSVTATLRDGTGKDIGAVQLHQDSKGVVQVLVDGWLPAGDHGVHIHAVGKCEGPSFTSAGAHFSPDPAKKHGLDNPAGPHAGDLPNMTVAANGTVIYKGDTDRVSLTTGKTNIFDADGSALVVHKSADDQKTDPTGNSGDRIACAVIAPAAPGAPSAGTGLASDSGQTSLPLAGLGILAVFLGGATIVTARRRA